VFYDYTKPGATVKDSMPDFESLAVCSIRSMKLHLVFFYYSYKLIIKATFKWIIMQNIAFFCN